MFLTARQLQSLITWWPRCSAARARAHRRWWRWTRRRSPPGSSLWSRAGWGRWRRPPAGTRRRSRWSSRSPGTSAEDKTSRSVRHAHSVSLPPVSLPVWEWTLLRWGRGRPDPTGTTTPSAGSPPGRRTPCGRTAGRSHCGWWAWRSLVGRRRWIVEEKPKEHHQLYIWKWKTAMLWFPGENLQVGFKFVGFMNFESSWEKHSPGPPQKKRMKTTIIPTPRYEAHWPKSCGRFILDLALENRQCGSSLFA